MISQYLADLNSAEHYLRLGNKSKFSNETIEAAASDCVFLSSPRGWRNIIFNVPHTVLESLDLDDQIEQSINLISSLEASSSLKKSVKRCQTERLDQICYYRPLLRIIEKLEQKRIGSIVHS